MRLWGKVDLVTLKNILIANLKFEDITTDDIDDLMPLFGEEGLGLDSVDSIELVLTVDKEFGVKIIDSKEYEKIFANAEVYAIILMQRNKVYINAVASICAAAGPSITIWCYLFTSKCIKLYDHYTMGKEVALGKMNGTKDMKSILKNHFVVLFYSRVD